MLEPRLITLAGLQAITVGPQDADTAIVLLHGHSMQPSDLAPFAHSLALPALFVFPQGPVEAQPTGHAWWPVDVEAKSKALEDGPRDLFDRQPPGLIQARAQLKKFLAAMRDRFGVQRLVLGGFSQGAMLACEWTLHSSSLPHALLLLSASRVNFDEWATRAQRLRNLPVLASHGRQDPDLAFEAGERLRDFLSSAGAVVTWLPFEGRHEIPLVVWRGLRRFLKELPPAQQRPS